MRPNNKLEWLSLTLAIIGGVNWVLYGLTGGIDVIAILVGSETTILARLVYMSVGLGTVHFLYTALMLASENKEATAKQSSPHTAMVSESTSA